MKKKLEITIETNARWYNGQNEELKNLALQTFLELEKKQLPKKWKELKNIKGYYVNNSSETMFYRSNPVKQVKNTFATKEQAEASIALAQLSQLREIYRGGWVPDWSNNNKEYKYVIKCFENKITKDSYRNNGYFLSFQDAETRDLFLENFMELIEKAKPLIF